MSDDPAGSDGDTVEERDTGVDPVEEDEGKTDPEDDEYVPQDETARTHEAIARTYGRWTEPLSAATALVLGLAVAVGSLLATGALAPGEFGDPAALLSTLRTLGTFLTVVVGLMVGATVSTVLWFSLRTPADVVEENPQIHPAQVVGGLLVATPALYALLWLLPLLADRWPRVVVVPTALLVAYLVQSSVVDWVYAIPERQPAFKRAAITIAGLLSVLVGLITFALGLWPPAPLADYVVLGVYATVLVRSVNAPKDFATRALERHLDSRIWNEMRSDSEREAMKEAFLDATIGGDPDSHPGEDAVEESADAALAGTIARAESLGVEVDLDEDDDVSLADLEPYDDYLTAVERRRDLHETAPEGVEFSLDPGRYHPDDPSVDPADLRTVSERLDVYEEYAAAVGRIADQLDGPIDAVADRNAGLGGVVATLARETHPDLYDSTDDARRAARTLSRVAGAFAGVGDDPTRAERILERYEETAPPVEAPPSPADLEAIESAFDGESD